MATDNPTQQAPAITSTPTVSVTTPTVVTAASSAAPVAPEQSPGTGQEIPKLGFPFNLLLNPQVWNVVIDPRSTHLLVIGLCSLFMWYTISHTLPETQRSFHDELAEIREAASQDLARQREREDKAAEKIVSALDTLIHTTQDSHKEMLRRTDELLKRSEKLLEASTEQTQSLRMLLRDRKMGGADNHGNEGRPMPKINEPTG